MNIPQDTSDDWNVEVSAETADRAEEVLREFATDVELDLALIVDAGGGLVAGVATRPDVHVDTVGALVAGAFGAMRALAGELGESRLVESVHHGVRDVIHLRDINGRFILLGLTERALPAGLIRVKAAQVSTRLAELLAQTAGSVAPVEPYAPEESVGPVEPAEPVGPAEERRAPAPVLLSPFEEEEVEEEEEANVPPSAAAEEPAAPEGSAYGAAAPGALFTPGTEPAANQRPRSREGRHPETGLSQPEEQGVFELRDYSRAEQMPKTPGGKFVFEIR